MWQQKTDFIHYQELLPFVQEMEKQALDETAQLTTEFHDQAIQAIYKKYFS